MSEVYAYLWSNEKIVVDLEKAPLVQEIFDGYLQCQSIGKLKAYLDENEVTNSNGNCFSKEALRIILTNRFYVGYVNTDSNTQGNHEPIISSSTFHAPLLFSPPTGAI